MAKSVHVSTSATGSNEARAESCQPSSASAAKASVPRNAVGPSGPVSPKRTPITAAPSMTTVWGRPGAIPWSGPPGGSAQVPRSPTVSVSVPGFSTHHSKTPTGSALRSRSPAMTGESCSPTSRTPPRTSGSKDCHARGNSASYVPPPTGRSQPQPGRSSIGGRTPRTVARVVPSWRPTKTANPSAATGSKRWRPTSRCQRAASPRNVRPMLPVPRPPIGMPAHSPSSIIDVCTLGRPTESQGTPMPRRQAIGGMAGQPAAGSAAARGSYDAVSPARASVTSRPRSSPRRA